jgi:hypothetical protein
LADRFWLDKKSHRAIYNLLPYPAGRFFSDSSLPGMLQTGP